MSDAALHLPAQTIAAPTSISAQAQAFLTQAAARIAARGDAPGNAVEEGAAAALQFMRPMAAAFTGEIETIELPHGALLYRITPANRQGRLAEVAYFDIHGGGFIAGGGELCRLVATLRAMSYGCEVFAVDYRLLPEHPYPAALDDCLAAYRRVLDHHDAGALVVGGSSAGGNLAAALMLRARDEGLALPAGLLLLTPALDLTMSGDSHATNKWLDVNLYGGAGELPHYPSAEAAAHPYVSPLFGDFGKGWPPTLLSSGTRDLLLSDTVRMHRALRRAGVRAELHVTEAGPHGGFMGSGAPEDMEVLGECRRFILEAWGSVI